MAKAPLAFLVTLTGDHASAAVLSQILYWHQGKLRVQRKGTRWLAKSRTDMCAETGVSLEQYKRIMPLLVRQGWIVVERGLFNNKVTPHIQLTEKGRSLLIQLGGKAPQSGLVAYDSNQLESYDSNLITDTTDHYITAESTALGLRPETGRVDDPDLGSGEDQIKIIPQICQEGTMNAKQILAAHKAQLAGKTPGSLPAYWKRRCYMATGKTQHTLTGKERGQLGHLQKYLGGNTRTIIDYVTEHWWTFATAAQTSAGLSGFPADPHIGFLLAHYQVAINLLTPVPVSPPPVETPVQPIAPVAKTEPPHVMTSQELTEMLEWIKSS